jgi:hypothetical protein
VELQNSYRRAKPHPVRIAVFLRPKFGELWPGGLGNTIPTREIPRAVPVAVLNLLATIYYATSKLLQELT